MVTASLVGLCIGTLMSVLFLLRQARSEDRMLDDVFAEWRRVRDDEWRYDDYDVIEPAKTWRVIDEPKRLTARDNG